MKVIIIVKSFFIIFESLLYTAGKCPGTFLVFFLPFYLLLLLLLFLLSIIFINIIFLIIIIHSKHEFGLNLQLPYCYYYEKRSSTCSSGICLVVVRN